MRISSWAVLVAASACTALITYNLGRHPDLPHTLLSAHEDVLHFHSLRRNPETIQRSIEDIVAAERRELDAAAARAEAAAAAAAAHAAGHEHKVTAAAAHLQASAAAQQAAKSATSGSSSPASSRAGTATTVAAATKAGLDRLDPQAALSQRVCGSPAVDGYAHVKPDCLYKSPSAVWQLQWEVSGGRREDLRSHVESNADYDGLAVTWGIGNKKASVEECAEACRQHKPNPAGGGFEPLPCNTFSFCPDEVCFEPDVHSHSKGDCWLKFQEGPANPEVNFRGNLSAAARSRHPNAPAVVQWHSGVLLPAGVAMSNGTWSPRYDW